MANKSERKMPEIDLSDEISRAVTRNPGEQVTCKRVSDQYYRCNWWRLQTTTGYDNPAMLGMLVTTSRICRSEFLRARKSGDQLSISVVAANATEPPSPKTAAGRAQ